MIAVGRKGTVIRCIDHLDISAEAKLLAKDLVNQIDMPVVFLIDHDMDKQYAIRHKEFHNQYWVLANHQKEQSEYERVLLSNIYRGIQTRKRFLHPTPVVEYENFINEIKNSELQIKKRKLYYELLRKITAFVTTLDAEHFFKPRGFEVSSKQKQWLYDNRIMLLEEYLEIQKRQNLFSWCWEVEYMNILDYARISSFHTDYYIGIAKRLKKIRPESTSERCLKRLSELMEMISNADIKYVNEIQEDVTAWITKEIIRIMELGNKIVLEREYALIGKFKLENGKDAEVYSFVPDDYKDKNIIIQAMRQINECILFLQEYHASFDNMLPDVHANLINSCHQNAYSNIIADDCYISITSGLLIEIMTSVHQEIEKASPQYIELIGAWEVCARLRKYALFYITAHEYAHIINGDCKPSKFYQPTRSLICEREDAADNIAKQMLYKILPFQYRIDMNMDQISQYREMWNNCVIDRNLLDISCNWCDVHFSRLRTR